MGTSLWAAYVLQTVGLVGTTAGKNAFLTGTYCVLVPFIGHTVMGEKLTRYNLGAAFCVLRASHLWRSTVLPWERVTS